MMRRVVSLVFAATLVAATGAWAQAGHITGRVASVDTAGHSITFTDGRTVFLEPSAQILAGNQQIALDAVRPGTNIVIIEPAVSQQVPAAPSQTLVTAQPGYVQPLQQHPPINASGIVASVDPQTGVITFQDGRMVQATGQTFVWQREALASVQPGQHVFLRGAEPVGFRSAGYWQGGQSLMGTVQSVDQAHNTIVLSDGTVVQLNPSAQLENAGSAQHITISQLQPGSQIVIHVPAGSAVSQYAAPAPSTTYYQYNVPSTNLSGSEVSALPRSTVQGRAATISSDNVLVVEGPEAP